MLMLHAGLTVAVVVLASAIGVYVYVRCRPAVQGARRFENERRRRAVLDDFGDGAVWQMGHRATNAIERAPTSGPAPTHGGFLPRMTVRLLIPIAKWKAARRGEHYNAS